MSAENTELQASTTAKAHEAAQALESVKRIVISNDAERQQALVATANIKEAAKASKAEMTRATKPMRESLEVVRGWFRPAQTSLAECETVLKGKITAYDREQSAKRDQALREAAEAGARSRALEQAANVSQDPTERAGLQAQAGAARGDAGAMIVQADIAAPAQTAGAVTRRVMKHTVDDVNAAVTWCLSNNMGMLLTLDDKALKALAKTGNPPAIPGVRWIEDSELAINTAKVLRG